LLSPKRIAITFQRWKDHDPMTSRASCSLADRKRSRHRFLVVSITVSITGASPAAEQRGQSRGSRALERPLRRFAAARGGEVGQGRGRGVPINSRAAINYARRIINNRRRPGGGNKSLASSSRRDPAIARVTPSPCLWGQGEERCGGEGGEGRGGEEEMAASDRSALAAKTRRKLGKRSRRRIAAAIERVLPRFKSPGFDRVRSSS
jgi:hypothetical protein